MHGPHSCSARPRLHISLLTLRISYLRTAHYTRVTATDENVEKQSKFLQVICHTTTLPASRSLFLALAKHQLCTQSCPESSGSTLRGCVHRGRTSRVHTGEQTAHP